MSQSKPVWKTIKVKEDTYQALSQIQAILQLTLGRRPSMDETIAFILGYVPEIKLAIEVKERADKMREMFENMPENHEREEESR